MKTKPIFSVRKTNMKFVLSLADIRKIEEKTKKKEIFKQCKQNVNH